MTNFEGMHISQRWLVGMEDVQCLTEKIAIYVQSLLSRFLGFRKIHTCLSCAWMH